uniref:C-type LECtin n=1 Tax=Parastrongyloides trichosuri TaxID=131310 RepID=A0A0N4Z0N6_PARTI
MLLVLLFLIKGILISSFDIRIGETQPCLDGWVFMNSTQQCFYFSGEVTASQDAASTNCQNYEGGQLASILSQNDYDTVYNMTKESPYLSWIGLQTNEYGIISWTDGHLYNFTKFSNSSKPLLDHKQCFALKTLEPSDGYLSLGCKYTQPYVCKQHASNCPKKYYNSSSGYLSSSNYPNNYYNNLNCLYYITGPTNYRVNFTFKDFDVENNFDYVLIYDGPDTNSPIIGNYTGNLTNFNTIASTSNTMTIKFKSDFYINKKGWYAYYCIGNKVDVIQLSGPGGELTSSNFPDDYFSSISQYYKFTTPNETIIRFKFNTFWTEKKYDYVVLFDGPTETYPIIANISGKLSNSSTDPLIYRTSSNYGYMYFKTDSVVEYEGWDLNWHTEYIGL